MPKRGGNWSVDKQSYVLAQHFLDYEHNGEVTYALAQTIQDAVEDWFVMHPEYVPAT